MTNPVDPSTTLETLPPVPAATAAQVLLVGDSVASDVSRQLEDAIGSQVDSLQSVYKVSSGLTRPDFFDWPALLRADIASANPTVSVVVLGSNDAQDILVDGKSFVVDSPEWRAEHARRVDEVLDILTADGRSVVWVGIPNAEHSQFSDRLRILEQTTRQVVAQRDGVNLLPDLLHVGDQVYIWDGVKEPEEYGAQMHAVDRDADTPPPTTA